MSCPVCASEDAAVSRATVEATAFGLPGGVLTGVEQTVCADCGEESYAIPAHGAVIKEYRKQLALLGRNLTAEEFSYLRRSLGLTGKAYAEALKISNVTISRIENGIDIPALQDGLIRALTLLDISSIDAFRNFTSREGASVEVNVLDVERMLPREITDGWQELPVADPIHFDNVIDFPVHCPREVGAVEFEADESFEYFQVAVCR